jgi:hypothetical protein
MRCRFAPNHHVVPEREVAFNPLSPDANLRWDRYGNVFIPDRFPYSFRLETVKVEKGKTTVWEIDIDGRCFSGQFVTKVSFADILHPSISYAEVVDRIGRGGLRLPDLSKVRSTLAGALEPIRARPLKRPVLRLPVPGLDVWTDEKEKRQGLREFDVGQIRRIREWLLAHYVNLPEPKQIQLAGPMLVPEIAAFPGQLAEARARNEEIRAKWERDTAEPRRQNEAERWAFQQFRNRPGAHPLLASRQERQRLTRLLAEVVDELNRIAK